MLGRQPLDALDDERVMAIYLACHAMDPEGPPAFDDLAPELNVKEEEIFAERAKGREVAARTPADPAAGRAVLVAMVEQAMTRLEIRLAAHRERQAADRPRPLDLLAFDDSEDVDRGQELSHFGRQD